MKTLDKLKEIVTCPDAAELTYDAIRQQWVITIYAQGMRVENSPHGPAFMVFKRKFVGANLDVLIEDIRAAVAREQERVPDRAPALRLVKTSGEQHG